MTLISKTALILWVSIVSAGTVVAQTGASVTWNLTAPDSMHVSSLSGNISSGDQTLTNLSVPASGGYSTSGAQRTSAKDGGSDGAWPGDASEVSSRYMQFRTAPTAGSDLLVTSVAMYLWVNAGSNMRANVYYSTDSTFATRTQIGTTFVLTSAVPGTPNVAATPNVTAPAGGAFWFRIYPWYTTSTTGKYVVAKIVTIAGTTTPSGNFISTSAAVLPSFMHALGTPSASQSYTVSGTTLVNDVVVTPPLDFEISTDGGGTWHGNASPVTLSVSGGAVAGQPVTILTRLNGSSAANYAGNIAHTSVSAAEKDVAVDGVTLASEPTAQSAVTIGTITTGTIEVNFSGGNGSRRIIVARSLSAVNWAPADGTPPAGVNSDFSGATDQGNGNRIVYDGTGSAVTVTGLSPNTLYYFASYEYNVGTGNSQNYKSDAPGTANATTQTTTAIVVTPGSLPFGGVEINTVSPEQTYTLSGTLLSPASGNISVTAPPGYRVSLTSGSGFDTLIQVPYSSGALGSTTIFVRFQPTAIQGYNGTIQNSGGSAATQSVSVTGSGSAPTVPNVFQAEDGVLSSAYVQSQYAGYTGTGYVDIANKTGASLEFLFRRVSAATDTVRIYYALGGSSRAYAVSLNGSSLGNLSFPGTGSWTTWSSVPMVIPLQAGVNRLNFAATTNSSDNANIDKIFVSGQSATAVYRLTVGVSGPGSVGVSPSSADSLYDAGTSVTLTASPAGGNILHHWSGTEESSVNPLILTMNAHKAEIGVFTTPAGFGAFPYHPAADGFASVDAFGYPNGTTGGSGPGSQQVYVTNYAQFSDLMFRRVDPTHALNFPPLTVYVVGTISGSAMLDVKDLYDVSIIGVGVDATLSGFGLNIVRSRNVIVRNLLIENSVIDGITVQANDIEGTGDHIWIDHCSVTNAYDGAMDVTHTASYVTLSWNHFYHHDKTCLMGHSDTQTSDVAMKVTYHHNYFDSTVQRHPRVRYGKAHVYNNYFRKNVLYGVSSNLEADVVVEGSYFLDVPIPTETSRDASPPGDLVERYNIFAGTTGPAGTRGTAFDPSAFYSYALDSAGTIPEMLAAYAGSGKFDFSSTALVAPVYALALNAPHGSITKTPNQATYDSGATVQLTAVPDTGYHFVNWSGDLTGSANPANIVMSSNRSVTANFAIDQFTITGAPSGPVTVNYGDSARFTFTPSGGYHIDSVIVDGAYQGTPASYTFYNVRANHTIRVVFAINQYTITSSAGANGTIAPLGVTVANYGASQSYTITPNTGYHVDSLIVDGAYQGSPASYTFYNVQANHTIRAVFAQNLPGPFALTVSATNGTVTKSPDQALYPSGTVVHLSAVPSPGYHFTNWSGDLGSSSTPDSLIMNGDKSVSAHFVVDEHHYAYQDKWNMVSLPLTVADARASVLFPTAISRAYAYDDIYKIKDTLVPAIGYWIKFNGAQSNGITGLPIRHDTAMISVGWNMIGSVTDSVMVGTAQVQELPSGIVTSHYFAYNGIYVSTTTLHEGKAYWVKASAPGIIVLNSSLQVMRPQIQLPDPPDDLTGLSKLTFTDAAGNTQTLYIGSSGCRGSQSEYELPPVPPPPLFDARFGSQRYLEGYESQRGKEARYPLSLQSDALPMTVKWEILDETKTFAIVDAQSGKHVPMNGTGTAILDPAAASLAVTVGDRAELPADYSLGANYPNPFNPTTSFVVGLPKSGSVSIRIYTMTGQVVRTLLEEERPGGYFTMQWDGMTDDQRVAGSGVYFVRMASGAFAAVRKIVMIR